MRLSILCLPLLTLLLIASTAISAEPDRTPVLVELFTSEGCSSCPPADRLLARLVREQPVERVRVVALGQHVDYWNDLGWDDPYSSGAFTMRQNLYASAFGRSSVYTPQMVIDGRTEFVGSDEARALRELGRAAGVAKSPVELRLFGAAAGSHSRLGLEISIDALPATASRSGADLFVAIAERARSSEVLRGENAGRELRHVAVARWIEPVASLDGDGPWTIRPEPIPLGSNWSVDELEVVVFAQQRGHGPVVALTTEEVGPSLRGAGR